MIKVEGVQHTITGLAMLELNARATEDTLIANMALMKESSTCGMITISGTNMSKDTQDAWRKFVELLEKDAASRLFSIENSINDPENNIPDVPSI